MNVWRTIPPVTPTITHRALWCSGHSAYWARSEVLTLAGSPGCCPEFQMAPAPHIANHLTSVQHHKLYLVLGITLSLRMRSYKRCRSYFHIFIYFMIYDLWGSDAMSFIINLPLFSANVQWVLPHDAPALAAARPRRPTDASSASLASSKTRNLILLTSQNLSADHKVTQPRPLMWWVLANRWSQLRARTKCCGPNDSQKWLKVKNLKTYRQFPTEHMTWQNSCHR